MKGPLSWADVTKLAKLTASLEERRKRGEDVPDALIRHGQKELRESLARACMLVENFGGQEVPESVRKYIAPWNGWLAGDDRFDSSEDGIINMSNEAVSLWHEVRKEERYWPHCLPHPLMMIEILIALTFHPKDK